MRVCHGTACHVQGSERVEEFLRRHLHMTPDQETDATGKFTLERVGCVGCCTLAPVVVTDGTTHGRVRYENIASALEIIPQPLELRDDSDGAAPAEAGEEICIGVGSCCAAGGSLRVQEILRREAALLGVTVRVKGVGCVGMCHQTPLVEVRSRRNGGHPVLYTRLKDASDEGIRAIVRRHFRPRGLAGWWHKAEQTLAQFAGSNGHEKSVAPLEPKSPQVEAFLKPQLRIATEHCGRLGPLDLDEYIRHDGFAALQNAGGPDEITDTIVRSGLRGRGGAGFPTGASGRPCARRRAKKNTSSATATRATPARSWTG